MSVDPQHPLGQHFTEHSEKSVRSLLLKLCQNPIPRLGRNLSSGTQSDPTISPINVDHDYYFKVPPGRKGAGRPINTVGDLLHTMAGYELPRVRTELQYLLIGPFLTPHPEQADTEFARHRHFCDPWFPTKR